MGRLRSPQRNLEVSLMKFCLQKLGGCLGLPAYAGRVGRDGCVVLHSSWPPPRLAPGLPVCHCRLYLPHKWPALSRPDYAWITQPLLALLPTGLPVVGEIGEPGYLEGGDFFPAGRDLALLGIGLRSNFEACKQVGSRLVCTKHSDWPLSGHWARSNLGRQGSSMAWSPSHCAVSAQPVLYCSLCTPIHPSPAAAGHATR